MENSTLEAAYIILNNQHLSYYILAHIFKLQGIDVAVYDPQCNFNSFNSSMLPWTVAQLKIHLLYYTIVLGFIVRAELRSVLNLERKKLRKSFTLSWARFSNPRLDEYSKSNIMLSLIAIGKESREQFVSFIPLNLRFIHCYCWLYKVNRKTFFDEVSASYSKVI